MIALDAPPEEPRSETAPLLARGLRFARRLQRVSWTIVDQALFAGSNFIIGLLAARWMTPADYGAFATALAVSVLVISSYEALFSEPMMVFGSGRYRDRFGRYLGGLLVIQLPGGILAALLVLGAAGVLALRGQENLTAAFVALAFAIPFILVRYLLRSACYADHKPRSATASGLVYCLSVIGGFLAVAALLDISYAALFAVMASSSVAASIWAVRALRPRPANASLLREVAREHWRYGRWSLSASLSRWIPGNIWYVILPLWVGLEGSGAFRALVNLNLVIMHVINALGLLLLPRLVQALEVGPERFREVTRMAVIGTFSLGLLYWAIVSLFGEPLISLMYAGKYVEYAAYLRILGFSPVLAGFVMIYASRARAAERPDLVFRSTVMGMLTVIPAAALTYAYGLAGATIGQLLLTTVILTLLVRSTGGDVRRWK